MDRVGIDIGSNKTVMFSSKSRGTIVTDKYNKREIPSMLELSKPNRAYGNGCNNGSNNKILLRRGDFYKNLDSFEGKANFLMFANYLSKELSKITYSSALIALPEYLTMKQKHLIYKLVAESELKVEGFISGQTAVAALKAICYNKEQSKFAIMDLGYSKTTLGFYEVVKNVLIPQKRFCIEVGTGDVDNALINFMLKKYNLPDTEIIRTRLSSILPLYKHGLPETDSVRQTVMNDQYDTIEIILTSEEFTVITKPFIKQLQEFASGILKDYDGKVEIVGKLIKCKFAQDIIPGITFTESMDLSESVALGACFAHFVNTRGDIDFKVLEIIGSEITLGNKEDKKIVFKDNEFINEVKTLEILLDKSTDVLFYENGVECGLLNVEVDIKEDPITVKVDLKVNVFGVLDILNVMVEEKSIKFSSTFSSYEDKDEEIEKILEIEKEYKKNEANFIQANKIRNCTEDMLCNLENKIKSTFGDNCMEESDYSLISEVSSAYLDTMGTGDLTREMELKDDIVLRLQKINDKLKISEEEIRKNFSNILIEIDEYLNEINSSVGSISKLRSLKKTLEQEMASFDLNVITLGNFDYSDLKSKFDHLEYLRKEANKEIELEEAMKKLRERQAKEAEELKKKREKEKAEKEKAEKEKAEKEKAEKEKAEKEKAENAEDEKAKNEVPDKAENEVPEKAKNEVPEKEVPETKNKKVKSKKDTL